MMPGFRFTVRSWMALAAIQALALAWSRWEVQAREARPRLESTMRRLAVLSEMERRGDGRDGPAVRSLLEEERGHWEALARRSWLVPPPLRESPTARYARRHVCGDLPGRP